MGGLKHLPRVLIWAGCLSLASIASGAGRAESLPAEDHLTLETERALGTIKSLEAEFIQLNPNGSASKGKLWLSRPSLLRIDYDDPSGLRLITSGRFLVEVDFRLKTTSLSLIHI